MDYRMITDVTSQQYRMAQEATKKDGLLYYRGFICIALGSYYGGIGTVLRITLSTGEQFTAIKTEEKSDAHTLNGCYIPGNDNIIEFIIDSDTMPASVLNAGDISALAGFEGEIINIERMK